MADEQLFGFTLAQIERLKRIASMVESDYGESVKQGGRRNLQPSRIVVGILTSAVAATTGLASTPKVGELNLYSFSSTGTAALGLAEKCYNFAPQAATTDRWTVCEREAFTGKLAITTQFCS